MVQQIGNSIFLIGKPTDIPWFLWLVILDFFMIRLSLFLIEIIFPN